MAVTIDLRGKVTLVTGGSRGLGAAMCRQLAQAGADVAVHYRTGAEQAATLARDLAAGGTRTAVVGGDFHLAADVERAVAEAQRQLGAIDILVNNVGREEQLGPALDLDWEAYAASFELNVRSAFLAAKLVAPGMGKRKWGRTPIPKGWARTSRPRGHSAPSRAPWQ